MKIIPSSPYKTNSKAEYRVFDNIRESFVNNNKYIAFHSLNLSKHRTKRFGEADFVIVCEYGLFVFEVKGGRINSNDGIWYSIDRNEIYHKIQNPFRQAEEALHSIRNSIKIDLRIPIGYGVICPDVKWQFTSSEWDPIMICDYKKFRNFESWLKLFFSYWHIKPFNSLLLSISEIRHIANILRPSFDLIEPLHIKLSQIESNVLELTEDQYKYLDVVAANKRVLCSGGAGTGKTFLAAELTRRKGNGKNNILLLCKSNWLKNFLEMRIQNENVIISTINSALVDMRRAGVDKYDLLIVDEGQDLFNFDDINILDSILLNGLENGEWYIFYDVNNQSGLFSKTNPEIIKLLELYKPAKVPLFTNCRNTNVILKKIQGSLNLDLGNTGTGLGPKIHEINSSKIDGANLLELEIKKLRKNGVSAGMITILSPFSYEKSLVFSLSDKLKKSIKVLDDYSIRSFPTLETSFAEIKNFKGLENEVIIVVDLVNPTLIIKESDKVLHYVAMSRARALLCLIWNNCI